MNKFSEYLKELRGERSLREMERITGLSHTYLSSLEKGVDPRSGKERKPTPEALLKIANSLDVDYSHLMFLSGYIVQDNTAIENTFSALNKQLMFFLQSKIQLEQNLEQIKNSEKLLNELIDNNSNLGDSEYESRRIDLLKRISFCIEENKELFEYMSESKDKVINKMNDIYYSIKSKI